MTDMIRSDKPIYRTAPREAVWWKSGLRSPSPAWLNGGLRLLIALLHTQRHTSHTAASYRLRCHLDVTSREDRNTHKKPFLTSAPCPFSFVSLLLPLPHPLSFPIWTILSRREGGGGLIFKKSRAYGVFVVVFFCFVFFSLFFSSDKLLITYDWIILACFAQCEKYCLISSFSVHRLYFYPNRLSIYSDFWHKQWIRF